MNDELKIPDWLKDCYKTLTTWEHEDRSFTEADRIFEISLIERISKLEALVREYRAACNVPHGSHIWCQKHSYKDDDGIITEKDRRCDLCRRAEELKG